MNLKIQKILLSAILVNIPMAISCYKKLNLFYSFVIPHFYKLTCHFFCITSKFHFYTKSVKMLKHITTRFVHI